MVLEVQEKPEQRNKPIRVATFFFVVNGTLFAMLLTRELIYQDTKLHLGGAIIGWVFGALLAIIVLIISARLVQKGVLAQKTDKTNTASVTTLINRGIAFLLVTVLPPLLLAYILSQMNGDKSHWANVVSTFILFVIVAWCSICTGGCYFLERYYGKKFYMTLPTKQNK